MNHRSSRNRKDDVRKYKEKYGREYPKDKKYPSGKRFDNQPLRENSQVEHYEEKPESAAVFIERMMCLGFSFLVISEQCQLKYHMNSDAVRKMIDKIRESWVLFTKLPEDEKRAELDMQLNNIMRLALEEKEFNVASVCMKRKMELSGLAVAKGTNTQAGLTINQILGDDLAAERKKKLAEIKQGK